MQLPVSSNNLHLFVLLCSCTEKNLNEEGCLNSVVTAPHGKLASKILTASISSFSERADLTGDVCDLVSGVYFSPRNAEVQICLICLKKASGNLQETPRVYFR